MLFCPVCSGHLHTVRHREGVYYACNHCGGRAATVPQIRRMAGDALAAQVLRLMNRAPDGQGPPCPFCHRTMRQFRLTHPSLELDTCRPCLVVWFDAGELESLPHHPPPSEQATELVIRERLAETELQRLREQAEAEATPENWHWLPMLMGLPTELSHNPVARFPWATVSLAVLMAVGSISAWLFGQSAIDQWGFIPAQWDRAGGLTLLTSFFLHADLIHLFGNLYFLLLCGDNVEEHLGPRRWLCLVLAAAMAGDLLHLSLDPRRDVPVVGASGGISGLITFYALQFPRVRLGLLIYWRLIRIPAALAWVFWMACQLLLLVLQIGGHGHVSAAAHLGGTAVGLVCWWAWREPKRAAETELM